MSPSLSLCALADDYNYPQHSYIFVASHIAAAVVVVFAYRVVALLSLHYK